MRGPVAVTVEAFVEARRSANKFIELQRFLFQAVKAGRNSGRSTDSLPVTLSIAMEGSTVARLLVRVRQLHRWVAPLVVLPLLVTVSTGVTYRLAKDWGGLSRDQVHWLMTIHEGEWLGPALEPVVVLLNAVGLLWMLATGSWLLLQNVRRQWIASRKEAGG
ncbi:PepSY-associated TM helix domain protein [Synechococcus sp. WH 8016]|nr:PepSY-associated TM helix domain protein [Synechococcus sp. WH 8016]